MDEVRISDLKQGDYFRMKDSYDAPIWVRNHYDRSSKKYSISRYDDVCHEIFVKGLKLVYVD